MQDIIELHLNFYNRIFSDLEVREKLKREKISILNGFIENSELVRRYNREFYISKTPRIVFCGINPGRNGAGKTGIPFIDYNGASQLLSDNDQNDKEASAQFILSVITEIGKEEFHNTVYMTNLSWFGFKQGKKNLNYYKLPSPLKSTFTDSFLEEMDIVQPKLIIPLSKEVEKALKQMKKEGRLIYPLSTRLPHPYYCSIGENANKYKDDYINRIKGSKESF